MFWGKRSFGTSIIAALALATGIAGLAAPAQADTFTWTNAGTSWSTAADWFDINGTGTVPGSLDVVQFSSSSYTGVQPTLSAAAPVGGVWDTGSGSLQINSSTLTLDGAIVNGSAVPLGIELDNTAGSMTISSALVLGASQSWLDNSSKPFKVTGAINDGGFGLTYAGSGSSTFSGIISGAGGFTMSSGSAVLSAANTFTGGTIVSGGTLVPASGSNFGALGAGNVVVQSGATVLMGATDGFFGGSAVKSTVSLSISGGGLVLDNVGYNDPLPTMYIDGGTLEATARNSSGNWALNGSVNTAGDGATSYISGGSLTLGVGNKNAINFNIGRGDTMIVSAAVIQGGQGAPLTKSGSGTLVLTASNNTYTGATTISAGTLQFGTGLSGQDGNYAGSGQIIDNGVLAFDNFGNVTYRGEITGGTGSFVKMGGGTLNVVAVLSATSTTAPQPSIPIIIDAGVLQTTRATTSTAGFGVLPVTINGGTLNLNGFSSTLAGLSGNGGMVASGAGAPVLTLSPSVASNYFGVIGGATAVTLNSTAAVQTFSGANTTTGPINVTAGTLALAGSGTLGSGNLTTITPGGVLDTSAFGGSGFNFNTGVLVAGRTDNSFLTDINGSLNLLPGGTLSPAGTGTVGTLTISGGLALSGGSLAYDPGDIVSLTGALGLTNTSYIVPTVPVANGTYTLFTGASVPANLSDLAMGGFFTESPRQSFILNTSAGTAVTLTVSGAPGNLTWTAANSNVWDGGVTQNWYNNTTQLPDYFYVNDVTTFDDSAGSAAGNVTITGTGVYPGSVTVSNSAVSYTFSGGPIAGPGFLVKTGPGTLTINTSDSYSGGTTMSGGLLNLGNSAALGLGRFTITGGSIDNTSGAAMTLAGNIAQTYSGGFTFVGSNPLNTGTGAVTLAAATDFNVVNSSYTIGGAITGNGYPVIKDGPGTLILGASSNYNGGVTLNSGVLNFASHALGTGGIVLNGGTLQYASGNILDVSSNGITLNGTDTVDTNGNNVTWQGFNGIFGSGMLVKIGAGNLTLFASESYTGGTVVNGGELTLYNTVNVPSVTQITGTLKGPLTIDSGGTVNCGQIDVLGLNSPVWTQTININAGTLLTSAAGYPNGWGTNISMTAGTMSSANGSYFTMGDNAVFNITGTNTSALISSVMDIGDSSNLTFNVTRGSAPADLIITGAIGWSDPIYLDSQQPSPPSVASYGVETGGIVINGNGIVVLGASNSYAGNTVINGGTLQVGMGGAAATLPTITNVTGPNGALDVTTTSTITDNGTLAFSSTDSLVQGIHFSALPISGSGNLVQLGPGNLTLNASNTYSGGTTISGGSLTLGNPAALGPGQVYVNGGAFNLNGYGITLAGLVGTGGTVTSSVPTTLTLMPTAATTFAGSITGPVAVTLNSYSAPQTFSGPNSYTGQTTITTGTLALAVGGSFGAGTTVINPGGVLDTSAYGSGGYNFTSGVLIAGRPYFPGTDVNGTLNVQGAAVSPGGAGTAATLTVNGGFGLTGGTISYDPGDQVAATGALSLGGSDYVIPNAPIPSGVYTLFTAGSLPGSVSNLAVSGLYGNSSRQTYTFAASGGSAVTLTVTGNVGNLTWTGGSNNTWDNQTSRSWFNAASDSADVFYQGDLVTFDDSAGSAAGNVTIAGAVQPAALTFNNNMVNYTLSGSGSIVGGTSLVMNGAGSLTINTGNAYTGGTQLNAGVLNANAAQALGNGAVAIGGGTLNANAAQALGSNAVTITSGALALNAAQSPASIALAGGQLNFGTSAALNSTLTISGGSLDNSSGSALTLGGSLAQNWNGSFTFLGSNPLDLGANPIALGAGAQVTVANSNLTVDGVISGSNSLTLNGPGTLTLTASNTYSGGTVLNSGALALAATGALGSGTLTVTGGTVQFANGNTQDISISNSIAMPSGTTSIDTQGNTVTFAKSFGGGGSGGLDKVGSGSLILAAVNTFTGNTTVNGGTLQLNVQGYGSGSSPGALISPTVTVNQGATLALNSVDALAYMPGVAALTIDGGTVSNITAGSRVTFENTVTMTGGLLTGSGTGDANGVYSLNMPGTVNAFNVTSDSNGDPAVVNVRAIGMSETNTSLVFNVIRGPAAPAADFIFNAALNNYSGYSGNGIDLTGNGIMVMTASNNYNGPTTINGGTLQLGTGQSGQDGSIANTSGVINYSALVYNLAGSQTASYPIGGPGSLTKAGSGLLTLSGSSSYTGGTTLSAGSLTLGSALALGGGAAGPLTVNAGLLNLNSSGYNVFAQGLAGSGGSITGAATLTLAPVSPMTYSGTIGGAIALTVNAPGATQTLAGANTYSGPTTVVAGTLALGSTSSTLGSGSITVNPGALLDVSAYGAGGYSVAGGTLTAGRASSPATDVSGTLNLQNVVVSPAGAGIAGTMTVSGGLGFSGGTLAYDPGDQIALGGALSLGGTDYVVPSVPMTSGVYTLFTAGSVPGSVANFAATGFYAASPRQSFTFAASGGTAVTLTVAGNLGNLTWTGGSNNTWDTGTSPNWFNANSSSTDVFYPADYVTFDDTAGGAAGNVTISGTVEPTAVTFNNSAVSYTLSGGPIAGPASLTLNGPGTVTLNSGNAYTGGTQINAGVLVANAVQALGSGPVALSGGQLSFGNSAALSGPLTITGGNLDNTSGAAMTLAANAQAWNGSFTFIGSNPLNTGTGTVALGPDAQVTVANSILTVGGVISGNNSLTVNGPGTLALAASNTYSGGTILNSGVLNFAAGGLGSGIVVLSGGTLQYAAGNLQDISSLLLLPGGVATIDTQGNNVTFANSFGGGGFGSLDKIGSGSLVLNAANSFTGNTTVDGGTLQLNVQGNGNTPGALMSPTITVNQGATLALNVMDALAYVPGVAALTIDGGTVSNTTPGSRVTLENTVTMVGGLLTGSGTGDSNGVYSINTPGYFNAVNATSDADGNPAIISVRAIGLSTSGTANEIFNVTRGPANPAADLVVHAAINDYNNAGSDGINLTGNGIMQLTASNNYSGATIISGGTLQLGNGQSGQDGSIGSTSAVFNDSAMVYDLAGSQTANYPISGNGSLTVLSGGLVLSGTNDYTGGTVVSGGTLIAANNEALADGSSLTVGDAALFGSIIPASQISSAPIASAASAPAIAAVPEPGTLVLLGAALGCAVVSRRVRRRRQIARV